MTIRSAIENAFGNRLADANLAAVVWPNKSKNLPDKPYIPFDHVPTENENIALNGNGGEIERGYFTVTVVAELNKFSNAANDIADQVAELFPKALELDVGDRKLRIARRPKPLKGYRDGSDWRVPTRIDYIVTGR